MSSRLEAQLLLLLYRLQPRVSIVSREFRQCPAIRVKHNKCDDHHWQSTLNLLDESSRGHIVVVVEHIIGAKLQERIDFFLSKFAHARETYDKYVCQSRTQSCT